MAYSGVFPVFDLVFKVNTTPSSTATMESIADMEGFSMSIDGVIQEWSPMDTKGWIRRLATGKGFVIGLTGKRNVGDAGNDYIHSLAFKTGRVLSTDAEIEFPDGSKLAFNCVVNVTNTGTGESVDVAPLEFEFQSDGEPTYAEGA